MKLNRVLLVIKLVEILAFHFLVKIIIGNTLENWDFFYEKTFTKFRRLFCQISRNVINDKAAFFYFSRKDVIPMWQMYYIKRKQNERRKSQ